MKRYLTVIILLITITLLSAQKTIRGIDDLNNYQYPDSVTRIILLGNKNDTVKFYGNFVKFKNLKTLDISNYNIIDLNFPEKCKTDYISLKNCNLYEIPASVFKIKTLRTLELRKNNITKIPEKIKQLKNLDRLNADFNKIKELPPGLFKIKSLEDLILSNNPIKKLPPEIGNMRNLEQLAISDTKISDLPLQIKKCEKLKIIYIKDTPLAKNSKRIKELEKILNKKLLIHPVMF